MLYFCLMIFNVLVFSDFECDFVCDFDLVLGDFDMVSNDFDVV